MTSRFRKWALSSPPAEWVIDQTRELLIGSLKYGKIPQHIAFVMDGNRRYARERRLETVEGHHLGYESLARVLEICYKSGVKVVTVYAFSIENFKRSKYEVDALMDLAKIKLTQMAQHGELLDRYGAKVRVIGQRDLLKLDVVAAIERAEQMTAHNNRCVLNICFPYTSREEITTAIRSTVEEYTKPISPPSLERDPRTALQEERIANSIRSQHLSDHVQSQQRSQQNQRQIHLSVPNGNHLSPSSSTTSLSYADDATTSSEHDSKYEHDHDETSSISSLNVDSTSSPPSKPITTRATTAATTPLKISSPTMSSLSSSTSKSISIPNPNSNPNSTFPSAEQITSTTLTSHMYTSTDPPLDLLIRTSGVSRLSDFMLWQCHETTQIIFLDILWPEFDLWSFLPVLWEWQWRARKEELDSRDHDADHDHDHNHNNNRNSKRLSTKSKII